MPPLIPARAFAAIPAFEDPVLSPDGKVVAARVRRKGQQYIAIHHLFETTATGAGTRTVNLGKATLNWAKWASDQHLVVSVRLLSDWHGQQLPFDRLALINRDATPALPLGPKRADFSGDDVIFWAPDGSFLLMSVAPTIFDWPHVYRIDIPSGTATRVQVQRTGIYQWVANSRGEVVAGIGFYDGRMRVLYRPDPDKPYETALRIRFDGDDDESEQVYIARIDAETQKGYVISRRGGDRWGLHEYDFKNKTFGPAVFAHEQVDIDDYEFDRDGKLRWISYVDDRRRVDWFDDNARAFYADLQKAVPDKVAFIESESGDKETKVVRTSSPTDPGSYFIYTAESGRMARVAGVNEALVGQPLADTQYVSYAARDGLKIPAYLTLPRGREPAGLPVIVMPHGGPFVRDEWDYDFLAQYLANRGYAVLQPNFRGSTGYGATFQERGYAQFGKGMQDDVDDGVKWLVASGTADPRRVCIVGWSYGGYAAQVAAFRNPDIYRCAVSVAGISDLGAMLSYQLRFMFGSSYRKWRAKVQGSASRWDLKAVSSLPQAQAVSLPLLIAHGTADDIVPVTQSDKLVAALKKAGKPYEYVRIDDGDHGLWEDGQRLQLLEALDRFLGAHNPTDVLRPAAAVAAPPLP